MIRVFFCFMGFVAVSYNNKNITTFRTYRYLVMRRDFLKHIQIRYNVLLEIQPISFNFTPQLLFLQELNFI